MSGYVTREMAHLITISSESHIVAAARAGSTLRTAREIFGYHTLQTRQP